MNHPSLLPPSPPFHLSHYKPLFLYPSLCSPSVTSPASHATISEPGQGDEAANLAAPPSRSAKSLTQGNHAKINYKVRTPPRESRRTLLWKCVGLGVVVFHVNPSSSLPMVEVKGPDVIRYQKLKFGVKIEEIVEGQGPEAHEGDLVEINYVCRRSNGYFVHSTVDQLSGESKPVILPLDEKEVIQGLKDVLVGMKVGGKRRALIPPSLGYVNEGLKPIPDEFGPRRSLLSHAKEPLVFEIQLLRLL